jgi:glycosyltransferase involved in cell wall biosynthesis
MLAAALSGLPFSMTVHGSHIFFERSRWRLDIKTARAAFVVCISHFAKSQVMAVAPVERWADLHIVHCGVDPSLYEEPILEEGRFRMLAVGRLDREKGLPLLLDAVRLVREEVPGLRLDLIGDGPDRAALEQRVRELGLDDVVGFLGSQAQAVVREQMRTTDLFVMASFAEGLPVVLMEALAARTPVLSTNIMGVPELVEDGVMGRLVRPADSHALAAALLELARATPEARRAMGDAGRSAVEKHFDVRLESAKLAALFQRYGTARQPG